MTDDSFVSNPPVMPIPVYSHCMVKWSSGNKMYIVGGIGGVTGTVAFQKSTQIFDIASGTFTTLTDQMRVARMSRGCVILEQERQLVVAGEMTTSWTWIHSVEILDLNTGTWSDAANLPFTGGYTPIPIDGYLYLLADNGFFYH